MQLQMSLTKSPAVTWHLTLKSYCIGELPISLDIKDVECGIGLGESLLKNKAKYHKKCKENIDADSENRESFDQF